MVGHEGPFQGLVQCAIDVLSIAFEFAINELTFVLDIASFGGENSFARLLSFFKITDVLEVSKGPDFRTFSMLLIVLPLAIVDDSSLLLDEDAFALSDSIFPISLIQIPIGLS